MLDEGSKTAAMLKTIAKEGLILAWIASSFQ
jgi:hypothetical protein